MKCVYSKETKKNIILNRIAIEYLKKLGKLIHIEMNKRDMLECKGSYDFFYVHNIFKNIVRISKNR